jgi:hypothetical protein
MRMARSLLFIFLCSPFHCRVVPQLLLLVLLLRPLPQGPRTPFVHPRVNALVQKQCPRACSVCCFARVGPLHRDGDRISTLSPPQHRLQTYTGPFFSTFCGRPLSCYFLALVCLLKVSLSYKILCLFLLRFNVNVLPYFPVDQNCPAVLPAASWRSCSMWSDLDYAIRFPYFTSRNSFSCPHLHRYVTLLPPRNERSSYSGCRLSPRSL